MATYSATKSYSLRLLKIVLFFVAFFSLVLLTSPHLAKAATQQEKAVEILSEADKKAAAASTQADKAAIWENTRQTLTALNQSWSSEPSFWDTIDNWAIALNPGTPVAEFFSGKEIGSTVATMNATDVKEAAMSSDVSAQIAYATNKEITALRLQRDAATTPEEKAVFQQKMDGLAGIGNSTLTSSTEKQASSTKALNDALNKAKTPQCIAIDFTPPTFDISCLVSIAFYWLLEGTSFFAIAAGYLLDAVTNYTIVNLATTLNGTNGAGGIMPAIESIWKVFRDLVNITFIFGLLYIAIGTILQRSGVDAKKMLTSIILGALLINFSLFFTEIIIDFSNNFAVTIYNQTRAEMNDATLAGSFIKAMGLQDISSSKFVGSAKGWGKDFEMAGKVIMTGLLGIVVYLVTAFVFFVISILLVVRFITFIILMIKSPIAIGGGVFPRVQSIAGDWWKDLADQAMFAPIFFLMLWAIMKFVNGGILFSGSADLNQAGTQEGYAALLLRFSIVIALLIAALTEAKKMSASGAGAVHSFALKAGGTGVLGGAGFALRNTVGRAANSLANSEWGKSSRFGGMIAKNIAKSSFDLRNIDKLTGKVGLETGVGKMGLGSAAGKGGYNKIEEDKIKAREEEAKRRSGKTTNETLREAGLNSQVQSAKTDQANRNVILADRAIEEHAQKIATENKKKEDLEVAKQHKDIEEQIAQKEAEMKDANQRGDDNKSKILYDEVNKLRESKEKLSPSQHNNKTSTAIASELKAVSEQIGKLEQDHKQELTALGLGGKSAEEIKNKAAAALSNDRYKDHAQKTVEEIRKEKAIEDAQLKAREKEIEEIKKAGKKRAENYAAILENQGMVMNLFTGGNKTVNKTAAAKIRSGNYGKSKEKKMMDMVKEAIKEEESSEKPKEEAKDESKKE